MVAAAEVVRQTVTLVVLVVKTTEQPEEGLETVGRMHKPEPAVVAVAAAHPCTTLRSTESTAAQSPLLELAATAEAAA